MKGMGLILLASLLWACDTLIRYPLLFKGVSASSIVFIEHIFLVAIFVPFMAKNYKKIWATQISHLLYFAIIGGLGSAVATLSFTKAFFIINPSLVILLQKLQPIVAILLARVFLKEPLRRHFLGWAFLCLIGGLLISHNEIFPGLQKLGLSSDLLANKNLKGYLLTLVAVVSWGSATVFGKKLGSAGYSEKQMMSGRFTMGLAFLLPMFLAGDVSLDLPAQQYGKIGVMVLMSGLAAMYLYYRGLKLVPARMATLAEMFFPLFAIFLNWIFLDAKLDLLQLIGGLLLIIGSTVVQVKRY